MRCIRSAIDLFAFGEKHFVYYFIKAILINLDAWSYYSNDRYLSR